MKKLILILLLLPLFSMGQFAPTRSSYVSPGEYRISGLNTVTGQAVNTINIVPQAYGGQPTEGVWFVQGATTGIGVTGANAYSPIDIRVLKGTTITMATVLTTGTGSITYDVGANITQLY
jgi:hypothetical protein